VCIRSEIRAPPCYKRRQLDSSCFPVFVVQVQSNLLLIPTYVGLSPIVPPPFWAKLLALFLFFIFLLSVSDRMQALFFFALRNLSRLDVGAPLFPLWIFD
jgi:hypothetical protein